ncbi:MAG: hypothetical protein IPH40_03965 [Polaromonas sp.]|nr:hypothetical protein [Polaromonas sp.]
MKGGIYLDQGVPHLVQRNFAVLNIKRGNCERFPENVWKWWHQKPKLCHANPAQNLHAAEVVGPSRSSEGLKLYYLVRWLNAE